GPIASVTSLSPLPPMRKQFTTSELVESSGAPDESSYPPKAMAGVLVKLQMAAAPASEGAAARRRASRKRLVTGGDLRQPGQRLASLGPVQRKAAVAARRMQRRVVAAGGQVLDVIAAVAPGDVFVRVAVDGEARVFGRHERVAAPHLDHALHRAQAAHVERE